jgi:hypothetical protein
MFEGAREKIPQTRAKPSEIIARKATQPVQVGYVRSDKLSDREKACRIIEGNVSKGQNTHAEQTEAVQNRQEHPVK